MNNSDAIKRFTDEIAHCLHCSKQAKTKVLEGFTRHLTERGTLSYEQLCRELGEPSVVAEELMESMNGSEILSARRKRRAAFGSAVAVLAILVGVFGGYAADMHSKFSQPNTLVVVSSEALVKERGTI